MTSKQLVAAALQGLAVPRIPAGPLAVHFCAGVAGYTLRQYTTNPRTLAECVLRYYERFQPDAVWLSADTWVSAEAMGATVGAVDDRQPFGGLGGALVKTPDDLHAIPSPDVTQHGRYPLMLEALSLIVQALGRDVFIVACFDQYPFSLAAALLGLQQIMFKSVDDPPFIEAVMARCAEYAFAYGQALSQAGADMLSGGDSPAGLLGPQSFAALALPAEQHLITRLKAATAKPMSLHICGQATPILPLLAASGADVLELDHAVDITAACRAVGPSIALWGNIDPVGVLSQGNPDLVRRKAQELLVAVKALNHRRFVLSSGCTLTVETPHENVEALIDVGRRLPAGDWSLDILRADLSGVGRPRSVPTATLE